MPSLVMAASVAALLARAWGGGLGRSRRRAARLLEAITFCVWLGLARVRCDDGHE